MKIKNNLISGFFASLGGVLTKVAFGFGSDGTIDSVIIPIVKRELIDKDGSLLSFVTTDQIYLLKYLLHLIFMLIGLTTSGLMMTYYVKSMQENGAGKATVYNFAVNYIGSLVFGALFFNEVITQRLLIGMSFILSGTFIISTC